ncbi:hypothetical protein CSB45_06340 [candidate division KSB3 bacterium]|uniref:Methyltransferase type 11 domain-containing protein n=1 Tax=candidate division KSB3 bacterium TaxID=2044937 RepID=A0A2G6E6X5_9BACT|nr:MAG: hypothetical protein CSB45_06340 [candidate division KSB3 bacterium]PIE30262.1 MAG: hypothetical protein CSA57_05055 [candidate division KSB3 bacterium]
MLTPFVRYVLSKSGYTITKIPKHRCKASAPEPAPSSRFLRKILKDPLNPDFHLLYAEELFKKKRLYLAYAEAKTAVSLATEAKNADARVQTYREALPDTITLDHNQYFRLFSLSAEIMHQSKNRSSSVLDVGGGQGELAAFIPEYSYCLAEPAINGISGTALPFPDNAFDYSVSCHVLEHIPVKSRERFLDQLLAKSQKGVILLNPFFIEKTCPDERIRLFLEITGAKWAEEHLDNPLPEIREIQDYAAKRSLELSIKPNGTSSTSAAYVFMSYFAEKAGQLKELQAINAFFNTRYTHILNSHESPNAYLMYLGKGQANSRTSQ